MIRTRDLILFILAFFLLVLAIFQTISTDNGTAIEPSDPTWQVVESSPQALHAVVPNEELDRQSNIARLREKMSTNKERIEPVPSVETPEVQAIVSDSVDTMQRCLYPDDAIVIAPRWPLYGVKVQFFEGARMVYLEQEVPVDFSTTTPTTIVTNIVPLLQLPLLPKKELQTQCVPSEIVGVTNEGILIFNKDINSFRQMGPDTLIGYARDGFPIYGMYTGDVDQCGGYDHPSGYRYSVSAEREYILGCFVSIPTPFTL